MDDYIYFFYSGSVGEEKIRNIVTVVLDYRDYSGKLKEKCRGQNKDKSNVYVCCVKSN